MPVLVTLGAYAEEDSQSNKVYRTTDEFGRPVYSDSASEDAREVELEEPATFPGKALAEDYEYYSPADEAPAGRAGPSYSELAIVEPQDDETIRSNPGNFAIHFQVSPQPRPGHRLQLLMDDKVYREITSGSPLQLTNVDRGTHRLRLRVVDSDGDVVQQGPVVTMHLMRHSILHPQGRKAGN